MFEHKLYYVFHTLCSNADNIRLFVITLIPAIYYHLLKNQVVSLKYAIIGWSMYPFFSLDYLLSQLIKSNHIANLKICLSRFTPMGKPMLILGAMAGYQWFTAVWAHTTTRRSVWHIVYMDYPAQGYIQRM